MITSLSSFSSSSDYGQGGVAVSHPAAPIDSALFQIQAASVSYGQQETSITERISAVMNRPMDATAGLIWIISLVFTSIDFIFSQCAYAKARALDPAAPGAEQRVTDAWKRSVRSGVMLAGITANTLYWSHTVKIVPLSDLLASYIRIIGYVGTIFMSTWDIIDGFNEVNANLAQVEQTTDPEEKAKLWDKINLGCVELSARIATFDGLYFQSPHFFLHPLHCPY